MERDESSDFGGGVLYQYVSASVFMLAGTLFFIFLTKVLSTTQVGNISLLLAIVQLFSILFSLGMRGAMEHYLSYFKGKGDRLSIMGNIKKYGMFTAFLGALSFGVIFSLSNEISLLFYHNTSYSGLIRLVSIDVALAMTFNVFTGITTGLQHFKSGGRIYMAGSIAVYGIATTFLIFTGSVKLVVVGWIIGYSIGILLYVIHVVRFTKPISGVGKVVPIGEILRYSIPLFASSILFFGSTYIDRLIVVVFLNLSQLGIYNLALLIAQGIAFFINPLNNLLLPKFSEMYSQSDRTAIRDGVRFSANVLTLIYTPVSLGVAALAPSILLLFGNANYLSGSIPLTILVIVSAIFVNQFVLVQALSGTRKTQAFLLATSLSFLGNLGASFFLIPRFGLMGAAVANSLAPTISFSVILLYAFRSKVASFNFSSSLRIWVSSILMLVIVASLQFYIGPSPECFLLGIFIGVGIYIPLLRLTRAINRRDAFVLIRIFSGRIPVLDKVIMAIASG